MNYKTIVLERIQNQPALHSQLAQRRALLSTVERYARDLRNRHWEWIQELSQARPDQSQTLHGSEALELALSELESWISSDFPQDTLSD